MASHKNGLKCSEQLKKSIIKARNTIRKKFRELHEQKLATKVRVSEVYQPIIEPLKTLVSETKKNQQQQQQLHDSKLSLHDQSKRIKNEKLMGTFGANNASVFKTALPSHRRVLFEPTSAAPSTSNSTRRASGKHEISGIDHLLNDSNDNENFYDTHQNESTNAGNIIAGQDSDAVEENLMKEINASKSPQIDAQYGLQTHHGELTLGNDKVTVQDGKNGADYKYCIRTKMFPVTPGLTSLLLESNPRYYTEKDLKAYKDMLQYTNAHRKSFSAKGAIDRNSKSTKYNKIIAPLFPNRKSKRLNPSSGDGLPLSKKRKGIPQTDYKIVEMENAKINYTYWDDPNELVDRLRLLLASTSAGHTGHNNEIISIIEELHEAKFLA